MSYALDLTAKKQKQNRNFASLRSLGKDPVLKELTTHLQT